MKSRPHARWLEPWLMVGLVWVVGCDFLKIDKTRFLSPDKVIKAPDRSPINPILPSVGMADADGEILPNATFPAPDDCAYTDEDYAIGPTDILDISILDLFSEGLETTVRREVSASGYVDLPQLTEQIKAEGLTKEKLKEAIRRAYSPNIIKDPTVSVMLAARRQNTFSILGAIGRPGSYSIVRKDMRLLDALAMAGDVSQTSIRYIYVIRPTPAVRKSVEGAPGETPRFPQTPPKPPPKEPSSASELPPLPEIPEDVPATQPASAPAPPTTQPSSAAAAGSVDVDAALRELGKVLSAPAGGGPDTLPAPAPLPRLTDTAPHPSASPPARATTPGKARSEEPANCKWVFTNGRWVSVAQEPPEALPAPDAAQPHPPGPASQPAPRASQPAAPGTDQGDPFGWKAMDKSTQGRVIAVNLDKLKNGDPRMNIIVRDNDIIQIPPLQVGEFYVMGEVSRPGVYTLTGRHITVKQALAAAGNLGPLAWPENSVLIRRIGPNQEQIIPLNVEAICRGEESDIFLKPDDVLAIGTDVRTPFMAVVRNAFRMTYGFGFIYDRNFSDPLIFNPGSNRFTRW